MQEQVQQAMAMAVAGGNPKRRGAVLEKDYFFSLGLSNQGLRPRDLRGWNRTVSNQDVMNEFVWNGASVIRLTHARTIQSAFLKTLVGQVYALRGANWGHSGIAFAKGAIAAWRGWPVDWVTFAHEAQFKGRWPHAKRPDHSAQTAAPAASDPRQGERVVAAQNALDVPALDIQVAHETPSQRTLGMADKPGSGSSPRLSQMYMGLTKTEEKLNKLYRSILEIWPKPHGMLTQVSLETMREGSGSGDGNEQAAQQCLEVSGPGLSSALNEEMQVDASRGHKSAVLALPRSSDPGLGDMRPLAGSCSPGSPPQPACQAASPEGMAKRSDPDVKLQGVEDLETRDYDELGQAGLSRPVESHQEMQVDVSRGRKRGSLALAQSRAPESEHSGVPKPSKRSRELSQDETQAVIVHPPEPSVEHACIVPSPGVGEDPRLTDLSETPF